MKPVVTYKEACLTPEVGGYAMLMGLKGHPRQATGELLGAYVYTSEVVRVGEGGEFETLNTIYRPEAR